MSRYIDADALKDAHIECPDNVSFFDFGEIVERFLQTIDKQPTVDAVPVVRCRECKHQMTCGFVSTRPYKLRADWFCADGEEITDGKED